VKIALVLYPRFTGLDIIGPFQVLASVPGHDSVFVAADAGPVTDGTGRCPLTAGVSAGIDMALTLLARIHGPQLAQMVQLAVEYDPRPPLDAGSPSKAPAQMMGLRAIIAHRAAVPAPPGGL
jgi:hypothetical protein